MKKCSKADIKILNLIEVRNILLRVDLLLFCSKRKNSKLPKRYTIPYRETSIFNSETVIVVSNLIM